MKLHTKLLLWGILLALLLAVLPELAAAQNADRDGAQSLRQSYERLQPDLDRNPFGRPLHLESTDANSRVQGDVHARLDQPFETVARALSQPENWCEIFMLHLNTKYCRVSQQNGRVQLVMKLGSKDFQELSAAHALRFSMQWQPASRDYFQVRMQAPEGPVGTRDYRVQFSAIPLPGNQSFIELRYSYAYGGMGSLAMDTYLSTAGRNKVGFTRVGPDARFVKGYRGVVERNAMRYYLAIDTFLASLSQPENARRDYAAARWFDATEQYPRQLHEVSRESYLGMKRKEFARAKTTRPENIE